MIKVDINKIKIPFECEAHKTKIQCTTSDLALCGTPLCEICNEVMSIEDYVIVDDDLKIK